MEEPNELIEEYPLLLSDRGLLNQPGTLRPLLSLALPVLVEQFLNLGVSQTDTVLTGRCLEEPKYLAAMNLMAYAIWLLGALFQVVTIGATALAARFIGAGQRGLAQRVMNQAFVAGAIAAAVTVGVAMCGIDWYVKAMGLEADAAALARQNLWIILPLIPFVMLEQVGNACLRAVGDTMTGMLAMAAVVLSNALISYWLVTGNGPLPRLGWTGLAIGTSTGYFVGAAIVIARLVRGRMGLQLRFRGLWPDWQLLRRLLRIGLPGGIDVLSVIGCHMWFVSIVNRLGTASSAAHGVAVKIEAISYVPGAAFQMAAATMAGQYLGAGDSRRAGRAVAMACVLGEVPMIAAALAFYFNAPWITGLYVTDAATVKQSAELLQIVAIGTPALSLLMILTGALRGAGDTRWPLGVTFVGLLGVRLPLAYLLCLPEIVLPGGLTVHGYNLGVRGAWYAMVTDLFVRCTLITARFLHGGWKRMSV